MVRSAESTGQRDQTDQSFANLVAQIADSLENGAAIDLEELIALHPPHAERLQELFPAMQAITELAREADADGASGPAHEGQVEGCVGHAEDDDARPLGDFRIIREIGYGGMGVVYEAEQISLKRRVALKVLSTAAVPDSRGLARFKNESLITAQLSHPNIVNVISVGKVKHVYYYAMPLIEGETLTQMVQNWRGDDKGPIAEPLDTSVGKKTQPCSGSSSASCSDSEATHQRLRRAANICRQVAEALEFAHQNDVLHRDVKPSNVRPGRKD